MRLRIIAGVVGVAFLLGACSTSKEKPVSGSQGAAILDTYTTPVDSLTAETWATAPLLKVPAGVILTADFVGVVDLSPDSLFTLFDIETGRFIGSRGNRRIGDGRLFHPFSVESPRDSNDGIRIFDAAQQAVLTYRLSGPNAGTTLTEFPDTLSIFQPLHLTDGRFVGTALMTHGRFSVFSRDGKLIHSIGETPGARDTFPVFIRQHAHRAKAALHPAESRVALLAHYADQLEIFDTAGMRLPAQNRPFQFDPAYNVGLRRGAPAVSLIPASRIGYVAIAADSQQIYGLFSGRSLGAYGSEAYLASHVHVFDWDGNLKRVIRLPHAGSFMAVAPDGSRLYVVSADESPALRVYRLRPQSSR